MISIKRPDNTTAILSNPNALRSKSYLNSLNRRSGQLKKRIIGTTHQSRFKKGEKHKALQRKQPLQPTVAAHFQKFLKEFFDFGFGNLVRVVSEQVFGVADGESFYSREDAIIFIKLVSFGIESALVMR